MRLKLEKLILKDLGDHTVIWLNKPEKLNTLDEQLVDEFQQALDHLEENEKLAGEKPCLIKAMGPKAFCAGGDVVSVINGVNEGRPYDFFFKKEYALDQRLYDKRALIGHAHGIIMGGGLGVLMGLATKVLDPHCMLAMPEVTIGFFPDVGASYFLQKIPRSWRLFMTLTGARLSTGDFYSLGLVDGVCSIDKSESDVINHWQKFSQEEVSQIDSQIKSFELKSEMIYSLDNIKTIEDFDRWASHTLEELTKKNSILNEEKWLLHSLKTYREGSLVSKVLTWHLFDWSPQKTRSECFEKDLQLAEVVSIKGDFKEGVRALLIDKDKKPVWRDDDITSCQKRLSGDLERLF